MPRHDEATPRELPKILGDNIKALMRRIELTQTSLGERLAVLGFSNLAHPKVLRRTIRGERRTSVDELAAFALALECNIRTLLEPQAVRQWDDESLVQGAVRIRRVDLPAFAYREVLLEPTTMRDIDIRRRSVNWSESQSADEVIWDMHDEGRAEDWVERIASERPELLPVPLGDLKTLSRQERHKVASYISTLDTRDRGIDTTTAIWDTQGVDNEEA